MSYRQQEAVEFVIGQSADGLLRNRFVFRFMNLFLGVRKLHESPLLAELLRHRIRDLSHRKRRFNGL